MKVICLLDYLCMGKEKPRVFGNSVPDGEAVHVTTPDFAMPVGGLREQHLEDVLERTGEYHWPADQNPPLEREQGIENRESSGVSIQPARDVRPLRNEAVKKYKKVDDGSSQEHKFDGVA